MPGGYVGVDAFFVIPGFLITWHLLREVDLTDTVRLWAFHARWARRLSPASILVLLFVGVGRFSVVFRHRADAGECPDWTTKVTAQLETLALDDIITTAFAQQNVFEPTGSGPDGFGQVWREWLGFARVTVLRDIPTTANRNGPQCLAVNADNPRACSNSRSKVLVDDDMIRAARPMSRLVNVVDLSNYFCGAESCYAVIGGASVYFDYHHMSNQFSATLASALLRHLPHT